MRLFFAAAPDLTQLFRAVLACVQRRLERIRGRPCSQGDALDAMLEHALSVWGACQPLAAVAREHRVFVRDGWRCTVPGCSSYRNLHGHHIVFRSRGGADDHLRPRQLARRRQADRRRGRRLRLGREGGGRHRDRQQRSSR